MAKSTGGGGNGGRGGSAAPADAVQPGEVVREANKIQKPLTTMQKVAQLKTLKDEIEKTEAAMSAARNAGVSYADRKPLRDLLDTLNKKHGEVTKSILG